MARTPTVPPHLRPASARADCPPHVRRVEGGNARGRRGGEGGGNDGAWGRGRRGARGLPASLWPGHHPALRARDVGLSPALGGATRVGPRARGVGGGAPSPPHATDDAGCLPFDSPTPTGRPCGWRGPAWLCRRGARRGKTLRAGKKKGVRSGRGPSTPPVTRPKKIHHAPHHRPRPARRPGRGHGGRQAGQESESGRHQDHQKGARTQKTIGRTSLSRPPSAHAPRPAPSVRQVFFDVEIDGKKAGE